MHFRKRGSEKARLSYLLGCCDLQLQRQIPAILQVDYWVPFVNSQQFFLIQHFSIDNFTFASIYFCSPGSTVLEKSLAFIWRQE